MTITIPESSHSEFSLPKTQLQRGTTARQARLLIVTDSVERATTLRSVLDNGKLEITCLTIPADLEAVLNSGHDVAVIDAGPVHIVEILRTLRASEGCDNISVLVQASRLDLNPSLTGVLPAYRAMPCSPSELVALARRRLSATGSGQRAARKML